MKKILSFAFAMMLMNQASAQNIFGFRFGMTKAEVEEEVFSLSLGSKDWIGATLLIQAKDHPLHSYLFNFCTDKLYEITQIFPENFYQMTGFVDSTIQSYGQPIFVSASGGMGTNGFIRPLNIYWKIDSLSYLRLMQLENTYQVIYQTTNSCHKVPN